MAELHGRTLGPAWSETGGVGSFRGRAGATILTDVELRLLGEVVPAL